MLLVADPQPLGERTRPVTPSYPYVDLTLTQLVVEHATETTDAAGSSGESEAELVDRIAQLESLQHAVAALQAATVNAFARRHVENRTAGGDVEPEKLERSVAAQVALACRVSPTEGRRRVRTARDLRAGLDGVRRLFAVGEISAHKAGTVVAATADLDPAQRAEVDRRLAARRPERLGVGRLRTLARSLAAEVAPEKFRARCAAARNGRRVTLRPSADGMSDLTAHLPAEQGAACYAALQHAVNQAAVDPAPQTRGRGQVMADTLVERLTGRGCAEQVDLDVQILVPLEALVDPAGPLPAEIPGHGPVPVDLLARGSGRRTWRRLVTRDGVVVGGDSRRRRFGGLLAELIRARDGHRCREPYCDAPIRHLDHIRRVVDGGRTENDNGRGTCEFHNLVREQPGWRVDRVPDGVRTTTPTGHTYLASEDLLRTH